MTPFIQEPVIRELRWKVVSKAKIIDIGTPVLKISNLEALQEMQRLVYREHPPTSLYLHTGEPQERVIWLTISAGLEADFENNHKFIGILRATCLTYLLKFEKWEVWVKTLSPLDRDLFTGEIIIAHSRYCQNTSGRRLILTANGYIGFAPEQCKEGILSPCSLVVKLHIFYG
jgi:hypothetical protein